MVSTTIQLSRVSVAMCTYNGARFLRHQLESIARQEVSPHELIICDDQSCDETLTILQRFSSEAPFHVRIVTNHQRLGVVKNFEQAIAMCTGDFIALSDQDDIWKPEKLSTLRAILTHTGGGYAFSNAELIDSSGVALNKDLWTSRRILDSIQLFAEDPLRVLLRRSLATGATLMFRSSLREALLPFSEYLLHDFWISLIASGSGHRGIAVSNCLVEYRQHSGQQIGVESRSVFKKLKRASADSRQFLHSRVLGYRDALERLRRIKEDGVEVPLSSMKLLSSSLEHFTVRADCRSGRRIGRIRKVALEAMTGRYASISNSWQSIAQDLLL